MSPHAMTLAVVLLICTKVQGLPMSFSEALALIYRNESAFRVNYFYFLISQLVHYVGFKTSVDG